MRESDVAMRAGIYSLKGAKRMWGPRLWKASVKLRKFFRALEKEGYIVWLSEESINDVPYHVVISNAPGPALEEIQDRFWAVARDCDLEFDEGPGFYELKWILGGERRARSA